MTYYKRFNTNFDMIKMPKSKLLTPGATQGLRKLLSKVMGLTQNIDVKVDEQRDTRTGSMTKTIHPDSM